jgi:glycosyltransferase involved in cell wall biosynthesis
MMVNKTAPIRILHVLGSLNRGGVETWLMHMLRHLDKDRFHFDFLVHDDAPGAYDAEARYLGAQVIPCLGHKFPLQYACNFREVLQHHKPYDVIHSHVNHYSGYVLWLAYHLGVPRRIAHSHTDTFRKQIDSSPMRKVYFRLARSLIEKYSTTSIAISEKAAISLYGIEWQKNKNSRLLYYGFDFTLYKKPISTELVRSALEIPDHAYVIGHVGRFVEPKNHEFILEIARKVISRDENTFFLLVGDGPLRVHIQQKAIDWGISDKIIFPGVRTNISELMLGAMDLFLLPSLYEGLGIVLVEAQAAGLPCLVSDVIPEEADVVPQLVKRLPLQDTAEQWATEVIEKKKLAAENTIKQHEALLSVEDSIFSLNRCMEQLEDVYCR